MSETASNSSTPAPPDSFWDSLDLRLDLASDWLSPILVKEARQSLKSLQFLVTFSLVLICAWAWSFFPVGDSYNMLSGTMRMFGYFVILAFPLLVVVPFLAFRSLAVEREDGTYELLTVTSLSPDQIILGKLGSVLVQMVTYVSAVAPCITFTYLLPGNDLHTILLILAYLIVAGVTFSALALLLATSTRNRYWQMILSGLVVIGLVAAFFTSLAMMDGYLRWGRFSPEYDSRPTDWEIFLIAAAFQVLGTVLCVQAAASRIAAGGENLATRIRITLLLVQAVYCGVIGHAAFRFHNGSPGELLLPAAIFWGLAGAMMMGESDEISPRAQRGLQRSFAGRLLFGWLFPGAASGYFFVLSSFATLVILLGVLSLLLGAHNGGPFGQPPEIALLGTYLFATLAFQLGLGRALFLLADRVRVALSSAWPALTEWQFGPAEAFVLHLAMTLVLACFSFCVGWPGPLNPWLIFDRGPRYWDLATLAFGSLPFAIPFLLWQIAAARGIVLAERLLPPERVVEDDRADRQPTSQPAKPGHTMMG